MMNFHLSPADPNDIASIPNTKELITKAILHEQVQNPTLTFAPIKMVIIKFLITTTLKMFACKS